MTEPTQPSGTRGRAAMTTWHLHPTFLRLNDGIYVRVLLVFDPITRQLVAAGPAETTSELNDVVRLAVIRAGEPTELRHMPNPVFGDLEANLMQIMARQGFRHDIDAADLGDEVVWVIGAARDVSDTVHGSKPATKADLVAALDACNAAGSRHGQTTVPAG